MCVTWAVLLSVCVYVRVCVRAPVCVCVGGGGGVLYMFQRM